MSNSHPGFHRKNGTSHGGRRWWGLLLSLALPLQAAPAQGASAGVPQNPAPPSEYHGSPPRAWIADVCANEIRAINHTDSYLRYSMHTIDAKGDRVRDIIESKDGSVARLRLKDGKPLSPEEDQEERDRLTRISASPEEFDKHVHSDATGKKLAIDLIQLMPDAMIYTYTPGQPQLDSWKGVHQLVFDYAPNPAWTPPTTSAEALAGLRGRVWIDADTHQLLRMEGEVFRGVNFGWGMLAHIYPGGKVALDQVNVGSGRWIFSRFVEQVKVRALMLKTINEDASIQASNFTILPGPISYQDAIKLLLQTSPQN